MLLLRDRLEAVPLMSLQTGVEVGRTQKAIIDPRRMNIVAFYCDGPHIDIHPAVIHVSDIREFSNIGMIIDSADSIMSPDELVRLQEVLKFRFELEGKRVVEEGGHKLGKVDDYTVDSQSFYIQKLHIRPNLWQSFSAAEMLIDRSQIVRVTDSEIIIKRATVQDHAHDEAAHRLAIDNPFRKAHPQPEVAKSQTDS